MPIHARSIYELGRHLGEKSDSEVVRRSAVSRIYYGLLLDVRERFAVRGRRQSHDNIRAALAKGTKKEYGDQLADLRELREYADYDLEIGVWDRKLLRAVRLAEQIYRELGRRFPAGR